MRFKRLSLLYILYPLGEVTTGIISFYADITLSFTVNGLLPRKCGDTFSRLADYVETKA